MQSFIVNVPDDKAAFFLELMNQLNFEILDIDERVSETDNNEQPADPFLDWEEERRSIKEIRKKNNRQ